MPNRILRDWTDSDRFDGISAEAERLFVRLLMRADDFGRFHAEARRVKAACFPLLPTLRATDVTAWLSELETRGLILRYTAENRDLLAIPRFGQRLKLSRAKFPPPPGGSGIPPDVPGSGGDFREVPGSSGKFREVPGSSGKFPPESETETETETETPQPPASGGRPANGQKSPANGEIPPDDAGIPPPDPAREAAVRVLDEFGFAANCGPRQLAEAADAVRASSVEAFRAGMQAAREKGVFSVRPALAYAAKHAAGNGATKSAEDREIEGRVQKILRLSKVR